MGMCTYYLTATRR